MCITVYNNCIKPSLQIFGNFSTIDFFFINKFESGLHQILHLNLSYLREVLSLQQLIVKQSEIAKFLRIIGSRQTPSSLFSISSVQSSSVTQLCPTLCDPMGCSVPGFPVHHQPLELAQTPVYQVGDTIQPSHPLSSPSPPAFNLSQHQGLFQRVSSSHQVAKVLVSASTSILPMNIKD